MRLIALVIVAAFASARTAAQDMPGTVDLGALGRTQVQSATARGYAERDGAEAMVRSPNGATQSKIARLL